MAHKALRKIQIHEKNIAPYMPTDKIDICRKLSGGGGTFRSLSLYAMTQDCSSHLFLPLQFLEIALRNVIHKTLSEFYAKNANTPASRKPGDWLFWLPQDAETNKMVRKALSYAKKDLKGREAGTEDVIPRLSFGTWVSVLSEQPDAKAPLHFWRFTANKMFPNAPHRTQKHITQRLRDINNVRNRLFHYELIWDKDKCASPEHVIRDIEKTYDRITETTRWISNDVCLLLESLGYKNFMLRSFDHALSEIKKLSP
jgi:hypothetical protein